MKPKRSLLTIVVILSTTLLLLACGAQDPVSVQDEPAPLPDTPAEPIANEAPDDAPDEVPIVGGDGTTAYDAFMAPLLDALTQSPPDYATLQSVMGSEFLVLEPFTAMPYAPAEAIAQFGAHWLPPTAAVTYDPAIDPNTRATFPLPTENDHYVYTTGWGDGSTMGVLLIDMTEAGYEWVGVYLGVDRPQVAEPIQIQFEPGATSATVGGGLPMNGVDEYIVYALKGQSMTVTITSPGDNVLLSIVGLSDGTPLVRAASDATTWTGVLPASQDYSIKAVSGGAAVPGYQLEVFIDPLGDGDSALDWVTLPDGICEMIMADVAAELGVSDIGLETNVPFTDYISGTAGEGCLITVTGTGADFTNYADVYAQLETLMGRIGWTNDMTYGAGGPTGMAGGFRRDAGLLLLEVGWKPSDDAECPDDQPISACDLTPEQQIYTITLSIAMQ